MKCTSCDVVEDLTDVNKVCKIYMARNKPVLLKGAAREWNAASKWNLDFFREDRFGAVNVNVSLDGRESGPKQQMSLKDYVNSFADTRTEEVPDTQVHGKQSGGSNLQPTEADKGLEHSDSRSGQEPSDDKQDVDVKQGGFVPYMRAWFFSDDCPDLAEDFPDPPPYFPDKFKGVAKEFQPPFTWIFIGPQGAYSPLHRDIWFTCAWMAQCHGRKRFVFFSPKDLKHVYRKEEGKEIYVDINSPNPEIFPTFHEANPIEAILEPGDVLYIPSKWPHFVECLTPSVSLTCNFANVANFKHVLVPYTRWLERRRLAMEMMKKMIAASGGREEGTPNDKESDLRAEKEEIGEEGGGDEDDDADD